ncbi:hypothetical protein C5Y96_05710 [Blastopirellula marina]|uniref:Uncharacterized protein n=1 Tax=Blastopirellula marina TaxID=124 RepID=A0A2S8G4X4_9BACT|nr:MULTISPECIES: hypothetical protein [Pirellulaceae]PQO39350.1 hypothetical protein C5Y96_05710 [Blastopirellula marina]RCS55658.1 hypothetical protein DTL36_05720 [Bremerella cremea]
MPNLLQIAKLNMGDGGAGIIEEASQMHPEISGMHPWSGETIPGVADSRTVTGLTFSTLVRTSVPKGGSFRGINQGVAAVSSGFENRIYSTKTFDKRFECDKAAADRYEDGWQAYLAIEASGIMEGGIQDLGKQFYYGTHATLGDAEGFPGLLQSVDANMVIDAGGTTADTGSSVWFVRWGVQDVRHAIGRDGEFDMGEVREETLTDKDDPTKKYTGYVQNLLFYPGLQVAHRYSCLRIKKLTADTGKGLTDALLGKGLSTFISNRKRRPTCIFATPRSIEQLRASRTATNATGAEAPTPTSYEGIPIIPTDGITNTEPLSV